MTDSCPAALELCCFEFYAQIGDFSAIENGLDDGETEISDLLRETHK